MFQFLALFFCCYLSYYSLRQYASHYIYGQNATLWHAVQLPHSVCSVILISFSLSMAIYLQEWSWTTRLAYAYLLINLIILACIDELTAYLPDPLTQLLLFMGLAWHLLTNHSLSGSEALFSTLITYLFLSIFSQIFWYWRQQIGFGGGDIKLCSALAAWFGWQDTLLLLFTSCVIALFICIIYRMQEIRFGPYLLGSTLILIFFAK